MASINTTSRVPQEIHVLLVVGDNFPTLPHSTGKLISNNPIAINSDNASFTMVKTTRPHQEHYLG